MFRMMSVFTLLAAALLTLTSANANAQEGKELPLPVPKDKWGPTKIENLSLELTKVRMKDKDYAVLLFKFTADAKNLDLVKQRFETNPYRLGEPVFLAIRNVDGKTVLARLAKIDGNITGKKGDAFEAIFDVSLVNFETLRPVEVQVRQP